MAKVPFWVENIKLNKATALLCQRRHFTMAQEFIFKENYFSF
jgi:hypothetical protein